MGFARFLCNLDHGNRPVSLTPGQRGPTINVMGVGNEMGIGRATKLLLLVCVAVAAVAPLAGQRPSSERNLETDRVTRGPSAPLNRQDAVLTIVKVKGSISDVDLEKRSVTIVPDSKKADKVELTFPQPRGREQIKVSKKAAKRLGKKDIELDELKPGTSVRLRYYPSLQQVMELIVEQPAG